MYGDLTQDKSLFWNNFNTYGWLLSINSTAQIEIDFYPHPPLSSSLCFLCVFLWRYSSPSVKSCSPQRSFHNDHQNCHCSTSLHPVSPILPLTTTSFVFASFMHIIWGEAVVFFILCPILSTYKSMSTATDGIIIIRMIIGVRSRS